MRIAEFQIDQYGPLPRTRNTCNGGITVFHGPNESGKTLLLEGILKLLDPDVENIYDGLGRVNGRPHGYVLLETQNGEVRVGDGQTLPDVAPIEATHLRNLFTVRDSDLRLRDQHAFYDSLTEQIGELHTSSISEIQSAFVDRGRLQPERRNVSSAAEYDNAGKVRDRAGKLADEIGDYVEQAREDALDETEVHLLRSKQRLREVESALARQQQAETVDEWTRLIKHLERYRETTAELEERYAYTQEELDRLTTLDGDIERATETIEGAKEDIAAARRELERLEKTHRSSTEERDRLASRKEDVDAVAEELDAFRDARAHAKGRSRTVRTARRVTTIGLLLGGIAAIAGDGAALLLAGILLAIGALGGIAWVVSHRRLRGIEAQRMALLASAQDAGFDLANVEAIPAAIKGYREECEMLESRVDESRNQQEVTTQRLDDYEQTIEEHEEKRDESEAERQSILKEADVEDTDAYREALGIIRDLRSDRAAARQVLSDALSTPENAEEPASLEVYWESELDALVEDIDLAEIDASSYNPPHLDRLEDEREELEERIETLEGALAEHSERLRNFANDARDLHTEPFVGEAITLEAETIGGLETLREDLEAVVARIERDAEISRIGLDIFDAIHDEEEEKITDLFTGDSRASELFRTITDGRYVDVTYDPDDQALVVEDDTGRTFTPEALSHGTREQLYLATRVSLSEQLLGNQRGFFLLDDAFLPADRERLETGFDVLHALAEDDWQIIYLTAKDEVGVDMVDRLDLSCVTLDPLP